MEKILPVAGATGSHSYAPTESNPPLANTDQDSDHAATPPPTLGDMDVDDDSHPTFGSTSPAQAFAAQAVSLAPTVTAAASSSTDIPSADISQAGSLQPATKRQRLLDDRKISKSKSSGTLSVATGMKKGKAMI